MKELAVVLLPHYALQLQSQPLSRRLLGHDEGDLSGNFIDVVPHDVLLPVVGSLSRDISANSRMLSKCCTLPEAERKAFLGWTTHVYPYRPTCQLSPQEGVYRGSGKEPYVYGILTDWASSNDMQDAFVPP